MSKSRAVPLPATGYVRLSQIIGNTKAEPPIFPIIPVSKSTWWKGIKEGRFPQPVKLGPRTTAWRVEDIRRLIEFSCETVSGIGRHLACSQCRSVKETVVTPSVATSSDHCPKSEYEGD